MTNDVDPGTADGIEYRQAIISDLSLSPWPRKSGAYTVRNSHQRSAREVHKVEFSPPAWSSNRGTASSGPAQTRMLNSPPGTETWVVCIART